ncbi:MAG TPA: phosphotransferase, partial [Blastocatellia bacterium]|nr:phosphotransferase [Blastocatellia bacterium]
SPVSCRRKVGIADRLARFDEVERMVALARPESLPKLRSLIDRLKRQSRRIGARPAVTLHGDLHLKNFFVAGQEIALIDLDNLCLGDPLLELGSFIASLHYRNLLLERPAQRGWAPADAFVRAYAESAPWAVTDSILNWYVAAALIAERAFRCVTRLKSGKLTMLDEIITLADEVSVRKLFVTAPGHTMAF